jgi:hypothetical protein
LRASEDSDDTQPAYRVAAFQTFLGGRISTFGDKLEATIANPPTIRAERQLSWRVPLFRVFRLYGDAEKK